MSNEIKIEDTKRDDMHNEIHYDTRCRTENRVGTYSEKAGEMERTLAVEFIFMVCYCGKKKRNPLDLFDNKYRIEMGESVDVHLPDRYCNYYRLPGYMHGKNVLYQFECRCFCRNERVSKHI